MLEVTGNTGYVRVGYHRSATLVKWRLVHNPTTLGEIGSDIKMVFTATAIAVDLYWASEPPTSLWLWMGENWWVWTNIKAAAPLAIGPVELVVEGTPIVKP